MLAAACAAQKPVARTEPALEAHLGEGWFDWHATTLKSNPEAVRARDAGLPDGSSAKAPPEATVSATAAPRPPKLGRRRSAAWASSSVATPCGPASTA